MIAMRNRSLWGNIGRELINKVYETITISRKILKSSSYSIHDAIHYSIETTMRTCEVIRGGVRCYGFSLAASLACSDCSGPAAACTLYTHMYIYVYANTGHRIYGRPFIRRPLMNGRLYIRLAKYTTSRTYINERPSKKIDPL